MTSKDAPPSNYRAGLSALSEERPGGSKAAPFHPRFKQNRATDHCCSGVEADCMLEKLLEYRKKLSRASGALWATMAVSLSLAPFILNCIFCSFHG